jgi:hypothetical protein
MPSAIPTNAIPSACNSSSTVIRCFIATEPIEPPADQHVEPPSPGIADTEYSVMLRASQGPSQYPGRPIRR